MRFPVRLTPDDNGTLLVTCPDLPEVTSFGEDDADALIRAADAVETALQGRINDRLEIPRPSRGGEHFVALSAMAAAKIEIYRAMQANNLRKAELARRLGWHMPQIDRLLNLSHASKLDQLEAAARALGRRFDISLKRAA